MSFLIFAKLRSGVLNLAELLITAIIIIVLTLIIVISPLSTFKRKGFESDVNLIVATLRDVQQRAVTQEEGLHWGVRFRNETGGRDLMEIIKGPYITSLDGNLAECSTECDGTVFSQTYFKLENELVLPLPDNFKSIVFSKNSGLPFLTSRFFDNRVIIKMSNSTDPLDQIIISTNDNGAISF